MLLLLRGLDLDSKVIEGLFGLVSFVKDINDIFDEIETGRGDSWYEGTDERRGRCGEVLGGSEDGE